MALLVLNKVSARSVVKATEKDWDQWVSILNKAGAKNWTHQEIVAFLKKKYRLSSWWQQGVTLGFEIHIGRREEGRNAKGEYSLTATRTIDANPKHIWRVLNSPEGLKTWLNPMSEFELKKSQVFECEGGIFGEVRTCKAPVRGRIAWQETDWIKPSILQLYVVARPENRAILVFYHEKLPTARVRDSMREHWRESLANFKELIRSGFTGL